MKIDASTPEEYLRQLPDDRKVALQKIREQILSHLPSGFQETINYGMIGYVVPHSLYPAGYHVDPALPLPFLNLASQKQYIALYHMGIYLRRDLLEWFRSEYQLRTQSKPDIGKSCIRFRHPNKIPYNLIGELCSKITPEDWIALYESARKVS